MYEILIRLLKVQIKSFLHCFLLRDLETEVSLNLRNV